MSNPWSDIYKEIRKPYLEGLDPVGKEDGDVNNDGKKDSSDSYLMKRRKAIAKAMGKEDKMKKVKNEHHQKDADGNPIDHGDGTPSNIDEGKPYTVTNADKKANTPAYKNYKEGKKDKDGKPMYKAADHLDQKEETIVEKPGDGYIGPTIGKIGIPNISRITKDFTDQTNRQTLNRINKYNKISPGTASMPKSFKGFFNKNTSKAYQNFGGGPAIKIQSSYEPAKVNKPNYSNWREDFVWDDNVDEAAKGKKLDVKENGVKNKIEINPDDGLKEEKKKLSEAKPLIPRVKTTKKDVRDMSKPAGTAKIDYRNLYMGDDKDDKKKKGVKGIAKELDKAVAMHKSQAKRLRAADVSEAKYERGASTYGKASIRNKRMFGKGGNAAPPEERGAAIDVRRDRHAARRGIKKGNKYHEAGKYRPEVHGVNKPEQERKGKNMS